MNSNLVCLATLATVVLLFGYEAVVAMAELRRPGRMARSEFSSFTRTATDAIPRAFGFFFRIQQLRARLSRRRAWRMSLRWTRVVAGLVLVGLAASDTVGPWGYIGVVPLLTGALGTCPVHSMLGANSCPLNKR